MTTKPQTRKAPAKCDAPGPDAKLIALGMRLEAAWAHEKSLGEVRDDFSDDAFEAAADASSAIVDRIEDLTATTLAGARVKAKAIWWCHNDDDFFSTQCTKDVRLAAGLLRNLLEIDRPVLPSIGGGANWIPVRRVSRFF